MQCRKGVYRCWRCWVKVEDSRFKLARKPPTLCRCNLRVFTHTKLSDPETRHAPLTFLFPAFIAHRFRHWTSLSHRQLYTQRAHRENRERRLHLSMHQISTYAHGTRSSHRCTASEAIYAKLRRPEASLPTSEIWVILHSVPLNSGRYLAPVSGSATEPAPAAVMSLCEPAQITKLCSSGL